MVISHLHLERDGLTMFLGSIEASVMLAAWRGCNSKGMIYRAIIREDSLLSYSSVSTVIDRLVDKGLLIRHRALGHTTKYTTQHSNESAFVMACIRDVFAALVDTYRDECELVYNSDPFCYVHDALGDEE